ncbi:hypothetical protein LY90DRAFT_698187 [Neocallimastix californiae]|uniref:Uncharacterized protein n=1 Tax=Neocallimastix californiae TaxID=1754190 RepID=A0A1Y2F794_9FUNG|nr:hypothetical protein LY90DRAFT_698187 [Neocallimastix californiae]|eukprot:ORY79206.1 hypothetical protein LY90DRAFT_698187 [Neocallimastix californiae]
MSIHLSLVSPTVITVGLMIYGIPVQCLLSHHVVTRFTGAEFPIYIPIYIPNDHKYLNKNHFF